MENQKTEYAIFGASGDLTKRYLLPALENMKSEVAIVSISRKDYRKLDSLIDSNSKKIFHLAIPSAGMREAIELIAQYNKDKKGIKVLLEKFKIF